MTEGKRQKQVAAEISKELNEIFLKRGLNMVDGGMVSISSVKITPDLYEARIYLSLFQVKNPGDVLEKFKELSGEIRGELGKRMRHQLRIIPQLTFYLDDTLDYVFKIEKLLDDIKKESDNRQQTTDSGNTKEES
ncbi:MAG: 30S ribosome-binding factor RbfA [Ginsengibacter sp.]